MKACVRGLFVCHFSAKFGMHLRTVQAKFVVLNFTC